MAPTSRGPDDLLRGLRPLRLRRRGRATEDTSLFWGVGFALLLERGLLGLLGPLRAWGLGVGGFFEAGACRRASHPRRHPRRRPRAITPRPNPAGDHTRRHTPRLLARPRLSDEHRQKTLTSNLRRAPRPNTVHRFAWAPEVVTGLARPYASELSTSPQPRAAFALAP